MRNDDKYLVVSDLGGGGTASAAKNRSDKCPDRKYAELKEKLKEAQKLISEQKKLIDKQDRYIIRLTDKLNLRKVMIKILEDGGIETIYSLVTTPKSKLMKIEGINHARLNGIARKIKPMGLELEMGVKYVPELRKYIKITI